MFRPLEQLEQMVKPLETAEYLGFVTHKHSSHFSTTCPYCQADLWIQTDGYLCQNSQCPMLAGSIIELASAATKSYSNGLQQLWECFGDRLIHCPDFTPASFVDNLCELARHRRRLFSAIRSCYSRGFSNAARAAVYEDMQNQGMHDPQHHMVGVLMPDEQASFLDMLASAGAKIPQVPKTTPLVVVPFWLNAHTPAAVALHHPRAGWSALIKLRGYNVAVAGLHQLSPGVRRVCLHDSAVAASKQNAKWDLVDTGSVSLACLVDNAPEAPVTLPSVLITPEHTTSHTFIARLHKAYPDARVLDAEGVDRPFDAYLFRLLRQFVKDTSLTPQGLVTLGSYNPQGALKNRLHQRFREAGFLGAADQISRTLYSVEIARTEKASVHETPEGYGIRRNGGHLEMFSNFVVRLTGNVTFGEGTSPHHTASVLMDDQEFPTMLPTRLLDNVRDLQDHVQLLAASKSLTVPVVRDTVAFKHVTYYLRSCLPRLPLQTGLPFLGWNFKRDTWCMPGLMLGMEAPVERAFPLHPDIASLHAFKEDLIVAESVRPGLPSELQTLLLMVVGCIIRGFRHEHLQPVQIRHDGNAVRILQGVFRGMGQTQAITKLGDHRPPDGLSAYPAWATTGGINGKVRYPWFLLTTHGRPVTGSFTDEVLHDAACTLRALVKRTVEALLSQAEPHVWTSQQSVLYSNGLALLGQSFLHDECGILMTPDLPTFEWVEKLLMQIPQEKAAEHMRYDFVAQKVTMDLRPFRDIDLPQLELELRRLVDNVVIKPGPGLELDAFSAFNLLETYYGSPPTLQQA